MDVREDIAKLVWAHVTEFRPRLCTDGSTVLFPRASGGARSPSNLGASLSALVLREIGLDVNPHLFRHLAGMRFLMARPGEYDVVRRILGHRKIDTTLNYYTQLEGKWALARYDETVLGKKERGK